MNIWNLHIRMCLCLALYNPRKLMVKVSNFHRSIFIAFTNNRSPSHYRMSLFLSILFVLCLSGFYLHVCLCTACMSSTYRDPKRASVLLELELLVVGCFPCGCWEVNPGALPRTASTLNCPALSPDPSFLHIKK